MIFFCKSQSCNSIDIPWTRICFCCTTLRDIIRAKRCFTCVISTTCILHHAVVCWVTAGLLVGDPAKARRCFPGKSKLPLTTEMLAVTWRWHLLDYWGGGKMIRSPLFLFYLATCFLEALRCQGVFSPDLSFFSLFFLPGQGPPLII